MFRIDVGRAEVIKSHRVRGDEQTVKLHWQYLRVGKCPICHEPVDKVERTNGESVHKCSNPGCVFVIVDEKLQAALARPDHPINRYPIPSKV